MLTPDAPAIEVADLHKRYGAFVAVDGVSFTVPTGEVFGLVGSNGAGKTTTLECLLGLREPDAGTVRVFGLDPARQGAEVRLRVGAQLQAAQLPPRLRVGEALVWFASFYPHTVDVDELLARWGLTDKRSTAFGDLSGGQRQRLFLALALLHSPELVCFDELTTGLDPRARRDTWRQVESLRDEGRTVLVVTHDMEEAERLCDRVAMLDGGRVVALGRPADLVEEAGVRSLEDVFLARTGPGSTTPPASVEMEVR
ncbi:MAG TPA: ABC transporter ATP-binding protein [Acidimicrobiales bacterium]|nr:ABC transporter ATP-binding protein [Acidimicrobiales bacterium]